MFNLFKRKSPSRDQGSTGPDGEIAYAIGDVHGCFDALQDLLAQIRHHAQGFPGHQARIIFLGDLMDRGPDSNAVIEYLRNYRPDFASVEFIMGNHEEVMLDVLGGSSDAMLSWFRFGGKDCARSYGVKDLGAALMDPDRVLSAIQQAVPDAHRAFIAGFKPYVLFGDYMLVHAGIKPGVPIEAQSDKDMRWIRKRFLDYKKDHPYRIVHGHTVVETPEIKSNRIAIDTGACHGGALTALVIKGSELSTLQSQQPAAT